MYKYAILLVAALLIQFSYGQQKSNKKTVTITGTIIDNETKKGLEYATVVLTPVNGKNITGGITDTNGSFEIKVPAGAYDIAFEFISFKTKTLSNQSIQKNLNLGTIFLEMDAEALDEVEVIAEKSTVEIRLDKKIYNVGKDMTVKGGTASDVLDNVPSVSVDVEGNVSLRGNENVRILVNGKPSGLVGLSGTDALRQLPAEAIEKVEVITSPSARYDAEGTAGILNIILRKGKAQGFNGSLNTTAGHPTNYSASINLNYRTKKINFFTNTGISYRNSPGKSSSLVTYFDDNNSIERFRNEIIDFDREGNRFNSNIGLEYFISDKSSITGSVYIRSSDGDDLATNIRTDKEPFDVITLTNNRFEKENEEDNTIEYSFNFTQDFNTSGHKLTMDFQFGSSEEIEFTTISDHDELPVYKLNDPERNTNDEEAEDVLIKLDYVLPLGENAQFEFGFKADLNSLYADYLVEEFDPDNNTYINNLNFSNTLDFNQDVYALYSQFGKKINTFSYLLGLRMESTDRNIHLIQTNEKYIKKFEEFFPTINLGLELSESENITLGYSRRLRRPRHWFLNPFESRISETYIRKGNVNLDPTYTNSFDFGYLKKWKDITLNASVYYQHAINNIEFAQEEEIRTIDGSPTLVIIRNPINLSSQDRYGFEFTANINPYKWWRITQSFNFFQAITEGNYNGINYDSDNVSWFTRLSSRISLPSEIDWETRGMYFGPSETAQSKRDGMISLDMSLSKDVFKKNGTLSLNVRDLLNSRKRSSTNYSPTTVSESEFQWRTRQFLVNFTYRLNQKKNRQRSNRNFEGGEEEMF